MQLAIAVFWSVLYSKGIEKDVALTVMDLTIQWEFQINNK